MVSADHTLFVDPTGPDRQSDNRNDIDLPNLRTDRISGRRHQLGIASATVVIKIARFMGI